MEKQQQQPNPITQFHMLAEPICRESREIKKVNLAYWEKRWKSSRIWEMCVWWIHRIFLRSLPIQFMLFSLTFYLQPPAESKPEGTFQFNAHFTAINSTSCWGAQCTNPVGCDWGNPTANDDGWKHLPSLGIATVWNWKMMFVNIYAWVGGVFALSHWKSFFFSFAITVEGWYEELNHQLNYLFLRGGWDTIDYHKRGRVFAIQWRFVVIWVP